MELILISVAMAGVLFLDTMLALCQGSLVKLRYTAFDQSVLDRLKARWAARRLLEDSDRTAQILGFGLAACAVLLGFLVVILLHCLIPQSTSASSSSVWLWQGGSLIAAVLIHYFIAEHLPNQLTGSKPERTLQCTAWTACLFEWISLPFRRFNNGFVRIVTRILKVPSQEALNFLDIEVQLRALGKDPSVVSPLIRRLLGNVLQMRERTVQDVLLPRHQIRYFDLTHTLDAHLDLAKETGHTRFPLCEGDLDHCLGIIHIKDIFRYRGDLRRLDLRKIKRRIVSLDLNLPLEKAFQNLLSWKVHMALVSDEFGGAVGLVTLERILEALVGSIQDEFDKEEPPIVALSENVYRVSGLSPLHDVEEALGVTIEAGEVSTFGGLITTTLGRIPKSGERLNLSSMEVLVEEVDEKRVIAVKVWSAPEGTSDADATDE